VPGDVDTLSGLPRLTRFTDRTITRRDRLAAELQQTRERGWALNDEERNPGVRAVATPSARRPPRWRCRGRPCV
jgi:IclR family transcriptional regulator, acetate operon repressor